MDLFTDVRNKLAFDVLQFGNSFFWCKFFEMWWSKNMFLFKSMGITLVAMKMPKNLMKNIIEITSGVLELRLQMQFGLLDIDTT